MDVKFESYPFVKYVLPSLLTEYGGMVGNLDFGCVEHGVLGSPTLIRWKLLSRKRLHGKQQAFPHDAVTIIKILSGLLTMQISTQYLSWYYAFNLIHVLIPALCHCALNLIII